MVDQPCTLDALEAIEYRVVEASPDAKIVISERGEIIVFNQQAELLLGYARTEVLGKNLRILLPQSTHEAHDRHIKRFFTRPHTHEMGTGRRFAASIATGGSSACKSSWRRSSFPEAGKHCLAVVRTVTEEDF